ncbi:MAG: hypothetical protein WD379_00120 [Dehalococcoidia bacterium]
MTQTRIASAEEIGRVLPSHYHADGRRELFRFINREGLQVYISRIAPGVTTAWHCHRLQTDTWAVTEGRLLVGLAASLDAPDPPRAEQVWLYDPHSTLVIPPGTWHGYHNPGPGFATLLNITDSIYDPDDELRADPHVIPGFWRVEDK